MVLQEELKSSLKIARDKGRRSPEALAFEFLETFRNVCEDQGYADLPEQLALRYGTTDLWSTELVDELAKARYRTATGLIRRLEKAVPLEWSDTMSLLELDVSTRTTLSAALSSTLDACMREAEPVGDVEARVWQTIADFAHSRGLDSSHLGLGMRPCGDLEFREHLGMVLARWSAWDWPPYRWREAGVEPTDAMRAARGVRPMVRASPGLSKYLLVILEEHSKFRWSDGDDPNWRQRV